MTCDHSPHLTLFVGALLGIVIAWFGWALWALSGPRLTPLSPPARGDCDCYGCKEPLDADA